MRLEVANQTCPSSLSLLRWHFKSIHTRQLSLVETRLFRKSGSAQALGDSGSWVMWVSEEIILFNEHKVSLHSLLYPLHCASFPLSGLNGGTVAHSAALSQFRGSAALTWTLQALQVTVDEHQIEKELTSEQHPERLCAAALIRFINEVKITIL